MTDYGHELAFGSFLTPTSSDPSRVVELARVSEELGLDLVTFSDHPYQPAHLDSWSLMAYVAAATVQVTLAPNVANLPLRPPAVLARAAASLDLLSGGRVELGLGAGAFWDGIGAMGGPHRTPGEAVEALEEAIEILRQMWDTSTRGGARVAGRHYQVTGAKRGPAPAHRISIWLGAYKPRMLRLTGRVADGWLPSSGYLPPAGLGAANAVIDEAAVAAGRAPADVRRLYNISGEFTAASGGFLRGPTAQWVDELAELAIREGISTFILGTDEPKVLDTYATEVAPAVREAVTERRVGSALRAASGPAASTVPVLPHGGADPERSFDLVATSDDAPLTDHRRWVEGKRPTGPPADPARRYSSGALASASHLIAVHEHLRAELTQVRGLVQQVADATLPPAPARSQINAMTMRQNSWTVGAYCAAYCRLVTTHHSIEDQAMFPQLRRADPRLAPVIDRLEAEHLVIHEVLEEVDRALVDFVGDDPHRDRLTAIVDQLTDTLRSHLAYEERELAEPIARLGLMV